MAAHISQQTGSSNNYVCERDRDLILGSTLNLCFRGRQDQINTHGQPDMPEFNIIQHGDV